MGLMVACQEWLEIIISKILMVILTTDQNH